MRLTSITCALVASLIVGTGNTFVLVAGPAKGADSGAISISSEPVGATVYVDGQFAGQTPIEVPNLAAGDHRVRLVMDGYLENGRLVTVDAGKTETLTVRLTARAQDSAARITGLKIVVLEGEDAVNIIDKMTAVKPTVEVRDKNDLPVSGAAVTFMINGGRNTATFANGLRQVTVTTDSLGRATITELNPLGKGAFQIEARAAYQGQTATTTIHQTNFATTAQAAQAAKSPGGASSTAGTSAGGGLSHAVIGGIVAGGAAAAAAVAKFSGGGTSAGASSPTSTPTSSQPPGPAPTTPVVSSVAVSPDAIGLQGATVFTFSAQGASDPSGGTLNYSYDFGDGATSPANPATHTYSSAGTFNVRLTVTNSRGTSATATTSVTVKNLTGRWVGTMTCPPARCGVLVQLPITITATQVGNTITGTSQQVAPGATAPESCTFSNGIVRDPRYAYFGQLQGCGLTNLNYGGCFGDLDSSLNRMMPDMSGQSLTCALVRQ
jgi:PKD repeat protein